MIGTIRALPLLAAVALAACGKGSGGNAMTNAAVPDGPMPAKSLPLPKVRGPTCAKPKLDLRVAKLDAARAAQFTTNFTVAFDKACTEGLLAAAPLVDSRSSDPSTLFVINAPEANVTSIYFNGEASPPMTILEAPFGPPPAVPSVEDIHEAIYCAMKGATQQEMDESGRCLVD